MQNLHFLKINFINKNFKAQTWWSRDQSLPCAKNLYLFKYGMLLINKQSPNILLKIFFTPILQIWQLLLNLHASTVTICLHKETMLVLTGENIVSTFYKATLEMGSFIDWYWFTFLPFVQRKCILSDFHRRSERSMETKISLLFYCFTTR